MFNKYLMASEYGFNGIYRAKLITAVDESDIRAYIPGINNINPFDSNGYVDLKIYEKNKLSYPVVQWCCYNLESKELVNIKGPAWVMFENGDVQRPVCVSYSVIGGESESNTGSVTNITISDSFGEWITKWTCTIYGNTVGDDNGICGWNGINYHTIKGCHVAIPISCITGPDDNFPEFSQGYGTVLEVRNPKNGKSVVAVVADCGNFGPNGTYNNTTALDLPPNTQNALDIHDSQSIEYRYIGHVSSWGGEQLSISDFNTSSGGSGSNIVENAKKYLGVPYVYGGATPAGFDCSGLTQYVYNESGITIPRVAADQYKSNSGQFVDKSQLQPGDLVFFTGSNGSKSNPGHVGIYVGNNQMIHAPSTGKTVRYQDISTSYYVNSYVGAKRYN